MSARILNLSDRRAARLDPDLAAVEAYWDGLRAGRTAPARAEIEPRGIGAALPGCFILESLAPGLARIRVSGRRLAAILGAEPRGMPVSVLFEPGARAELESALIGVLETPAVARLAIRVPGRYGRAGTEGQMLLLPLRSDLGELDRVLGAVSLRATPAAGEYRMTIDALRLDQIPHGRPILRGPAAPPADTGGADTAAEVIDLAPRLR